MHFPELALQSGSFGGARGSQRMHVSRHQRKLAKDYAQLVRAKLGFQLFSESDEACRTVDTQNRQTLPA